MNKLPRYNVNPFLDSLCDEEEVPMWKSKANEKQVGGDHYKQFKGFEPWDVIVAWDLNYLEGTALKYISRWKHKNGTEDLRKAIHFLEKAIEVEEKKNAI